MPATLAPIKDSTKAPTLKRRNVVQVNRSLLDFLLFCGILAALWDILINILVPFQYPGYSSFSQTVSELSAIGAPTKQLWFVLGIPFVLFEIAFGFGVFLLNGQSRSLRIAGALLIAYGLIAAFWPPMHQREVMAAGGKSMTDTLHIVFTAVTGFTMMVAMGFAGAALGKVFLRFSIATILTLLVFGAWTGRYAARLEANLPTPWMGVLERVNVYGMLVWLLVFAVVLLRQHKKSGSVTYPSGNFLTNKKETK
jgi:hypothetical protein